MMIERREAASWLLPIKSSCGLLDGTDFYDVIAMHEREFPTGKVQEQMREETKYLEQQHACCY